MLLIKGILRRGLLKSGLLIDGIIQSIKSLFDKLKDLDQPLVVAYEGDNPLETGRYPQPSTLLTFNGTTQHIASAHLTGSETVISSDGTATPSVVAGQINFTAGTAANVILSDGTNYPLNQTTGTIALDRNDNANPGTLVNGPTWTVDNTMPYLADVTNVEGYNKRMYFDGVDDYVETNHIITASTQLKLSFKITNGNPNATNMVMGAFSPNIQGSADRRCIFIQITSAGELRVLTNSDGSGGDNNDYYFATTLNDGKEHDIVLTYSIGGTLTLTDRGAAIGGSGVVASSLHNSDITLKIGNYGDINSSFTGTIRDITIDDDGVVLYYGGNDTDDWGTGVVNGSPENIFIPPSTVTPTLDCLGNALQFSGSVYPVQPVRKGSYAGQFDGSTTYLYKSNANFRGGDSSGAIEFTFITSTLDVMSVLSSNDELTNDYFFVAGIRDGKIYIQERVNPDNNYVTTVNLFNDGLTHTCRIESDGNSWSISVDGVDQPLTVGAGVNSGGWFADVPNRDNINIGALVRDTVASYFDGVISQVSVYDPSGTKVNSWGIAEGVGTTAHDTVGTDHLTWQNGSTGTEGAGVWAGRIDGKANASNLINGFSLLENGLNYLRIPYVNGSPHPSPVVEPGFIFVSENPPVYHPNGNIGHNGAETTEDSYNISEAGTPTAATVNLGNFSAITFALDNIDLQTITPIDAVYRRDRSTVSKDRLVAFYDTLTGTDRDLAETYSGGISWDDAEIWDDSETWTG